MQWQQKKVISGFQKDCRIFDPFFTTRQAGTGLGLAISQRIVNAHRGTIKVQSWPTVGTVFTIVLPAAIQKEHA